MKRTERDYAERREAFRHEREYAERGGPLSMTQKGRKSRFHSKNDLRSMNGPGPQQVEISNTPEFLRPHKFVLGYKYRWFCNVPRSNCR